MISIPAHGTELLQGRRSNHSGAHPLEDILMKTAPKILECTLRDGSYVVDFQFSADETIRIARRLDELRFPYIEVGHGVGLGASEAGMGAAAATDEQYMAAAREAVVRGRWGMFCIPGVAKLDHLDLAIKNGMHFVRVGSEISEVKLSQPFIEKARNAGMYVFANLMKSYVCSPSNFAQQAAKCADYGAHCVYVVDSAGGMLPDEIGRYIDALREVRPGVDIGFHGHDNLGMAVANALYCAQKGVQVVDTSLQGFGRSAGNTSSEQFITTLVRSGYDVPFDPIDVMQAGEELIRPLIREHGFSSLDTTAGLALFHSSYMSRVLAAAKKHRVDPRRLIIAICRHDQVNAPPELIEQAAQEVQRMHAPMSALLVKQYFGEEQA
jgi:4-hydroxy-2-oxovalerate aldolase